MLLKPTAVITLSNVHVTCSYHGILVAGNLLVHTELTAIIDVLDDTSIMKT
jgi:hypothetical protein